MSKVPSEDIQFRVMRALAEDPQASQRDIARSAGISLGSVNYCLSALIDRGLIKINNFRTSSQKLRYAYLLTPKGITQKMTLTSRFLKHKRAEYAALHDEIDALQRDLDGTLKHPTTRT